MKPKNFKAFFEGEKKLYEAEIGVLKTSIKLGDREFKAEQKNMRRAELIF